MDYQQMRFDYEPIPGEVIRYELAIAHQLALASYHDELKRRYARAASRPWIALPPEPSPPAIIRSGNDVGRQLPTRAWPPVPRVPDLSTRLDGLVSPGLQETSKPD
jgi:hypothetical protein